MQGRPTAEELVAAVVDTLDGFVERLDGRDAYQARVAANALRIVARELAEGDAIDAAAAASRAALPGAPASAADLATLIRDGSISHDDPALLTHLRADVLARIAVDSPDHPSVGAAQERWRDRASAD